VDIVIIDGPAALPVPDASLLAALCGNVLLVVRGRRTTTSAARQLKELVQQLELSVLGVVLNDVSAPPRIDQYYYARREQKVRQPALNETELHPLPRPIPQQAGRQEYRGFESGVEGSSHHDRHLQNGSLPQGSEEL
jgi:Mrp family chromosome partitioning ATPase